MNTIRKVLISLLVVGAVGGAAAVGAFSAFSATTSNPSNSFTAGSVSIGDNDSGTALYNVSGKKPGQYAERCIQVTYSGSLPATVKLYRSTFTGGTGLDSYIDLSITRGTGTAGDCSDFSGSTSVYSGTLNALGTDYTGGVSLTNGSGNGTWSQNDAVTYKVRATLQDDNGANGKATGTHSFTWEARNT
jgi:hypothetical protein